jgi:uncharacterized membrane protein (Fun14 family)
MLRDISPKVTAAAVGSAVSTLIWTIVSSATNTFSDQAITALTGSTATIAAFLLGYLTRDSRTAR